MTGHAVESVVAVLLVARGHELLLPFTDQNDTLDVVALAADGARRRDRGEETAGWLDKVDAPA